MTATTSNIQPAATTIHGCSAREQQRLRRQARVLAPAVFDGLPLIAEGDLLELGCGVGAELALLHGDQPGVRLTGVDLSLQQLAAARSALSGPLAAAQVRLLVADAAVLPFATACFDQVITIWLLEHVPQARQVLAEALRVLKPGGLLCCTEVDNRSFAFMPEIPVIRDWWALLNDQQRALGGDPNVGACLADWANALGAVAIRALECPVISSRLRPSRRRQELTYLRNLLLSAAPALKETGAVSNTDIRALRGAFARVRQDPRVHFKYSAVRLCARAPERECSG